MIWSENIFQVNFIIFCFGSTVRINQLKCIHFTIQVYVLDSRLLQTIGFFIVCKKLVEMVILYSKDLTTAKKVTSSGLDLMLQIITGLEVQCLTI